jgi:hypothetical protein
MVATLFQEGQDPALRTGAAAPQAPKSKIVGIAKLKCLSYMWRTFGVRNRLPILAQARQGRLSQDDAQAGFLPALEQGSSRRAATTRSHRRGL